ncbi:MAG: hypothetical protein JSV33_14670 [bacterium]|nr:MAG: hypothetical protein JSV33_14670 [bacterium]
MNIRTVVSLLGILALVIGATPLAGEEIPEEEPREPGGWIVSGDRKPLYWVDRLGPFGLSGTIVRHVPAREIRALLSQDDTLWVGTEGGLFAYNTVEDSVSSVRGPAFVSIRTIMADDTGSLWVGGDGGVSVRRDGRWIHLPSGHRGFFRRVTDIVRGDAVVWIATYGDGCAYIRDDSLTVYTRQDSLLDDRVLTILEQDPHTVWFGTASGLCRSDTLSWESMRYGSRIPIGAVEELALDEEGNLFLAIARKGVVLYNLGRVRLFGVRDGLPSDEIHGFSLDPTGRLWAAGGAGVSSFDGSAWTPYRLPGVNLTQYRFLSIHHDLEGICYLGTDEGTVFVLSRDAVREVAMPQGFPSKHVISVQRFGPALWFLAERSIYRLGEDLTEVTPPLEWCSGTMTDLFVTDDEEMWVATRFGILHFDGRSWNLFDRRQGLPTEHFVALSFDPSGSLWFASFDRGVLEFTGREWIHYTERNGLPQNRIGSLVVDGAGYPWILTADGTLARYSEGRWEEAVLPVPYGAGADTSGAQQDTLLRLDPGIRFLGRLEGSEPEGTRSRGNILGLDMAGNCLLARQDGIFRLTGTGWQIIDPPQRVSGFVPTAIIGTSRGEIWVGTESDGVYVRRRGEWIHVQISQGLTDGHIRTLCEDHSGSLWIGTQYGGVTKVMP